MNKDKAQPRNGGMNVGGNSEDLLDKGKYLTSVTKGC